MIAMTPLSWAAAMGALLFQAAGADPPKEISIRSGDPKYFVNLPLAFEHTVPRENPPRYVRSYGREPWVKVTAILTHGAGPLKQNPAGITPEELLPFVTLPPDAKRTFFTLKWRNLDVGVIEYQAVEKDLPVIGLSAVLPLQGNALTLTVSAPTPLEKEARADFQDILSRIAGATTNWYTVEELRKMETLGTVGKVGAGLMALYPIAWAVCFRGDRMRAHWVRVAWLLAIAVLLFLPVTSPGPTTMVNNLIVNAVLPLVLVSFAVRRVKLGIDEG